MPNLSYLKFKFFETDGKGICDELDRICCIMMEEYGNKPKADMVVGQYRIIANEHLEDEMFKRLTVLKSTNETQYEMIYDYIETDPGEDDIVYMKDMKSCIQAAKDIREQFDELIAWRDERIAS